MQQRFMTGFERQPKRLAAQVVARWMTGWIVGAAWCVAPAAWAAWDATASESISHVDNLLRSESGQERADTFQTTTLGLGADLTWSRQRLRLDTQAAFNRYQQFSDRDSTNTNTSLAWSWQTVGALSGSVSAFRNRSQYQYTGLLDTEQAAYSTQQGTSASLRLGAGGPWSASVSSSHSRSSYSLAALNAQAGQQNATSLSVGYRTGPHGQVQWVNSRSVTESQGQVNGVTPRSTQTSSQLTFDYIHSPKTNWHLNWGRSVGVSSMGQRTPSNVGGVNLSWQPTAKLSVGMGWQRDTRSSQSTIQTLAPGDTAEDPLQVITTGLLNEGVTTSTRLNLGWAVSVRSNLGLSYNDVRTSSASLVVNGALLDVSASRSRQMALSWSHTLSRAWSMSCSLTRERLSVSEASTLGHAYTARTTACSLSLRLQ
ncbi:hypothetical protein VITFI_CDS1304 [Vitreoscilla filiformis]|jgi:hypothetical protein|uniref:TIGR03016 family PEP-CTERM system-associated outer membrane protein n=2 Tax=Vitreoscilla filiformis TaxID=63 RepID=A0A221KDI2_VITFI|nr:hypothetical protein VITFI_CDS1304 [Vitreoscilla filiformis]